ncbi:ABC transporter substrate-binding protein [Maridesulfovibrio ferrireducens]|uniref:substrate-binding periplasmic protein n=1 Tax=Maridesulfovibrio ferrireducens TaxID=246191 RepID=UPI001A2508F5|nr:transporter substrate-binding domain-containing protein [Maridesulfovibrio ferrireducens]MBI9111280.1 transporter substrate-binding domain-containing protein [Maridesulfovibrio ferrireducens]
MKTSTFLIIIILIFSSTCTATAQPAKITLATHNLCPYGCYDENGIFDGCAVRVVKYAFNKMNIKLNIVVVPWIRAQRLAKDGKVDGFFAASKSEDRDQYGVQSAIIAEQRWNWYMLQENPLDPASEHFKKRATVASFRGSNMLKWLKANNYNATSSPPTTEHLLNMLLLKRFDAMLANDMVMTDKILKHNIHNRLKIITLLSKPLGVYFSKNFINENPDFLSQFNKHVEKYMKDHPLPLNLFACPLL